MEGRAYCGVYVRRGPQVCLVRAITASNGGRCECGETLDQATMGCFVPRLSIPRVMPVMPVAVVMPIVPVAVVAVVVMVAAVVMAITMMPVTVAAVTMRQRHRW